MSQLLEVNDSGIYCAQADVYIDPWKPVQRALITHAHGDHARSGSSYYLAHKASKEVLFLRLGDIQLQTVEYEEPILINGVRFSFHPAGHIMGSAQIRVEYQGEIWVVSGDYKTEEDKTCTPFQPVRCHTFITESTFGLPVYSWQSEQEIFQEVNQWWNQNAEAGKASVLFGYSLGKAQRILANVDPSIGSIFVHGAVHNTNKALAKDGLLLPETHYAGREVKKSEYKGSLIVAPPSAMATPWMNKFKPFSTGIASGWMTLRGARRRRAVDRGFILSDHADWAGLNQAIQATGAERVYVTHGYTHVFSRWLRSQGYDAHEMQTLYTGELSEINEAPDDASDLAEDQKRVKQA